ncbi:HAD family hydrolase [Roseinatronobacter alkalisoli]|uniref:phosphoglycolate phosphatase n=1 Tax=Roseinatronobacter alkalisoli TaxID=3028235 RepID=A0ABT5TDX3_9RHOB|nr:HAD-IA family hydrolase [Roseinatronobacter sp. HJB301]MDD7972571.1 HAD-IA family hydrolase [Roseinatronobacter sp. HJB301]
MTPELVIFDCDGVVVDSEILSNRFIRDEMAAHGLDLRLDQIMELFVGGTIAGVAGRARELGATLPPDWVETFYPRLCDHLALGTPMITGIVGVLQALDAAQLPYCIGSNGRHAKMKVTLGQHPELTARFTNNVFAAQDVARPKPAPDLFLHAAGSMGYAPDASVVIEDSATGARAARAAGMRCFGYAPEGDGAHLAAHGAVVFHSMADLPALLGI